MDYYMRFIGAFRKKTGSLSPLEIGVYDIMLDEYYAHEQPLPGDLIALFRLCRALEEKEQNAVVKVRDLFFKKGSDGRLHHPRCDLEIQRKRRISSANAQNGKAGRNKQLRATAGRPPNEGPGETRANTQHTTHSKETAAVKPPPAVAVSSVVPERAVGEENANGELYPHQAPTIPTRCPHQQIVALYHELVPTSPAVRIWDERRQRLLSNRWREDPQRQSLEWWRKFFAYVSSSRFLTGQTINGHGRPFTPSLEWMLKPANITKIIEGNYE